MIRLDGFDCDEPSSHQEEIEEGEMIQKISLVRRNKDMLLSKLIKVIAKEKTIQISKLAKRIGVSQVRLRRELDLIPWLNTTKDETSLVDKYYNMTEQKIKESLL